MQLIEPLQLVGCQADDEVAHIATKHAGLMGWEEECHEVVGHRQTEAADVISIGSHPDDAVVAEEDGIAGLEMALHQVDGRTGKAMGEHHHSHLREHVGIARELRQQTTDGWVTGNNEVF